MGRFSELYTDRGSHFCRTEHAGDGPALEQHGQVSRALDALGIRQILARSPEARGRSERAFGTMQGRLPQELRVAGITTYAAANAYLIDVFVPDFNRRFTARPAQPERVRPPVRDRSPPAALQSRSAARAQRQHRRLPPPRAAAPATRERPHYVRCLVLVHEFPDQTLGLSFQGQLLATYTPDGELLTPKATAGKAA